MHTPSLFTIGCSLRRYYTRGTSVRRAIYTSLSLRDARATNFPPLTVNLRQYSSVSIVLCIDFVFLSCCNWRIYSTIVLALYECGTVRLYSVVLYEHDEPSPPPYYATLYSCVPRVSLLRLHNTI